MNKPAVILFFKSHIDTYTRKDGTVVQAHDDKRTPKHPEIKKFMSDAGYKSAKKTHQSRGKVNGWDHVIDPLYGHHKLMTKYNVVGFDSEGDALEFAKHNKAKTSGYWGEGGHDGVIKGSEPAAKDWRDEENWHSRMQGKMKTHSEAELRYIIKDAREAAKLAYERGNDKKGGQYDDEAHYAAQELHKRGEGLREAKAKYDAEKAKPEEFKPDQPVMFEHPERGRKVAGTYVGVRDGQSVVRHDEDGEFKVNHSDVYAR